MEGMDWIFSGIGTAIVSFLLGGATGGAIGYKIGVNSKNKQSQKAGNNSTQIQIGNTTNTHGRQ